MHTNHRRKKSHFTKRHGGGHWMTLYSMVPMKREKSSGRRAQERSFMDRGLWDDLPTHYPKNIVWEYW